MPTFNNIKKIVTSSSLCLYFGLLAPLLLLSSTQYRALEKWKNFDKLNKEKAKLRNIDTRED